MNLNPTKIGAREKQILAGLFLSKFDGEALKSLGFESFIEAFNALGYGLGARPASIKNYRDEFDPLFENARQGWWKRPRREYCMRLEAEYRDLPLQQFAELVGGFVGEVEQEKVTDLDDSELVPSEPSSFAKRLMTGRAAEKYFQAVHSTISEFEGFEIEDTTSQGCGYDFRLWPASGNQFKAVEVKGMTDLSGWLSLTSKEQETAARLEDRFYLFVVKNFREKPCHELYANPLAGPLNFLRKERPVVQVSWVAAA